MIKRTVDVTSPAKLSYRNRQLVLFSTEKGESTIPIEDIGIIILSNPQISITHALQSACAQNNAVVICCDDSYLPNGLLIPLSGNTLSSRVSRAQIESPVTTRKKLWQAIVRQKIHEQIMTLNKCGADATAIVPLIKKVKSGDVSNVEPHAARVYWQKLFGEGFKRRPDAPGINALLNFGYSIVRSAVARSVVAAGLCPMFGVCHSNQYNHLALADDLVEPFRPWVDETVQQIVSETAEDEIPTVTRATKEVLLGMLARDCVFDDRRCPFMVALSAYVASFRSELCGEAEKLRFIKR